MKYCHNHNHKVALVYVPGITKVDDHHYCPLCEPDDIPDMLKPVFIARRSAPKPANPKKAYGDRKVRMDLVPPVLGIYAALKLKEGMIKYGFYNYREIDVEIMTYIGAIKRHLDAILDGEWMDPAYSEEVNGEMIDFPATPHLAGLIASAAIMADSYERDTLIDNRPPKGNASELLSRYSTETEDRPPVQAPRDEIQGNGYVGEGHSCYARIRRTGETPDKP